MRPWLQELAESLARTKAEGGDSAPGGVALKAGALVLALAAVAAYLGGPHRAVFASFPRARPNVVLRSEGWRVLYRAGVERPTDPAIWAAPPRAEEEEHRAKLKALRGADFWVAKRIEPETLAKAAAARANQLYLGFMLAHYRVYVDGELLLESLDDRNFRAVSVPVPMERLARRRPLDVAIRIFHDYDAQFPDGMSGDPEEIGFYDHERRQILDEALSWGLDVRPAIFFGVNVLAALAFLLLWLTSPRKQEYFWVGAYLLVEAGIQGWAIGSIHPFLRLPRSWGVPFVYHLWEGALALALGLSYARVRRGVFAAAMTPLLLAPLAVFAYGGDIADFQRINRTAALWAPGLCVLGAAACFLQTAAAPAGPRRRRLALFGAGLLAIALTFWSGATGFVNPHAWVYWHRVGHLGVILLMGWLISRDHREQDLKNEEARAASALALQVAHDIRSPLSALKALGALHKEGADLPGETRELLEAAIDRIARIADSMLDRQRPASRGAWLPLDDLAELAGRIVAEKRARLGGRPGPTLEAVSSGERGGLAARAQLTELERLLSNLVDNAVEASGGAGSVRVMLDAGPNSLELRVEDRGRGIPPDVLPRLGEKGSSFGKARGNGLGLYHARRCVESWGGSLRIESEPGKGTRLRITLPVQPLAA